MPLSPSQSQYRQLADHLRAMIATGAYPPGSYLPAEQDLAVQHGVSFGTVNHAIQVLRTEGLVSSARGRRAIVREIPEIRRNSMLRYLKAQRESAGGRGAFDTEIRRLGYQPRSDVEVGKRRPPGAVAATLEIDPKATAIMRKRRMYADDTPVQLATSWIPASIADGTALAAKDSGPGGIISRFAELGYAQTRIAESVRVRRPDREESEFLRIEEDAFVIEIFHVGYAGQGPVEVCVHVVPAYLWVLDYVWELTSEASAITDNSGP